MPCVRNALQYVFNNWGDFCYKPSGFFRRSPWCLYCYYFLLLFTIGQITDDNDNEKEEEEEEEEEEDKQYQMETVKINVWIITRLSHWPDP